MPENPVYSRDDGHFIYLATVELGQAHPVLRQEFQKFETLREQLKQVLNPEQFKIFLEWEESSNWIQAKEKERLFYQGVMEGLQFCSAVICAGQVPLSDYDE